MDSAAAPLSAGTTEHTAAELAAVQRDPAIQADEALAERAVFGGEQERETAWAEIIDRFTMPLRRKVSPVLKSRRRVEECVEEFWQQACRHKKLASFLRRKNRAAPLGAYLSVAAQRFAGREFIRLTGDPRLKLVGAEMLEAIEAPKPTDTTPDTSFAKRVAAELQAFTPPRRIAWILSKAFEFGLADPDIAWLAHRRKETAEQVRSQFGDLEEADGAERAAFMVVSRPSFYQYVRRANVGLQRAFDGSRRG